MHDLPTFETYGNYKSDNYGAHALCFSMNGIDVYFSYRTPVAFRNGTGLTVRENAWGPTTGKHLNAIDGGGKDAKAARLAGDKFELALKNMGVQS